MTFQDLLRTGPAGPEESQLFAEQQFPEVAASKSMHLWQPGDPFIQSGERFLLGIVTWSNYDLQLLDQLADRVRSGQLSPGRLDLFNLAPMRKREDLEPYIPGLGARLNNPPALGIWIDGVLTERLDGHSARTRILEATS
jgi:hypothetical protein